MNNKRIIATKDNYRAFTLPRKVFAAALISLSYLISPAVIADRNKAAAYYEDAVVLHNDGKQNEAIIQLKNALQQDSSLLPARVLLGTVYMENGDNSAAEKELREAERLGADRALTAAPLAHAYLKQHKYRALIANLPLDNYPVRVHGELLSFHGQAYLELRDVEKAQKTFTDAAKIAPRSAAPLNGLALLALRSGDLNASRQYVEKALANHPDNIEALNIKASAIHAAGDLNAAAEAYGSVLQRQPENLKARLARAGVYIDVKNFAKAEQDLTYLEEHYPLEPRVTYFKSLLYTYTGQMDKAKDALQKTAATIAAMHPDFLSRSREHLLLAGLTYHALGQLEQAASHLKHLILLTPDAVAPKKLLASVLMEQQQYSDITALLQPLVDNGLTNDHKLLTLLGQAYMHEGDTQKAIETLEQAVAINNNDADSRLSLALTYYNAGNIDQATNELTSTIVNNPQTPLAGATLATIYLKQNEPAKALKILKTVLTQAPDNATYQNLLGAAQAMNRDFDAARQTFLKLEAANPTAIPVQISLSRLDTLTGHPDKARERLTALLLKKGAQAPNIMLELAKNEEAANNIKEAIRWADKARTQDSRLMAAKLYLINLYHRNGEPRKALEVALEAQRNNRDDLDIMGIVAEAYIALNDHSNARTELKNMATLAGFDSQRLYRIAQMQYRIKAYKNAEYTLQKAVQGAPDFIDAQVALIEIRIGLNKLNLAEKEIRSLAKKTGFKDADRLLGDIATRRGEHNKAIQHYRAALKNNQDSMLTIKLYQAHAAAGEWQQATRLIKDWVNQHPQDINARQVLAEAHLQQNQLAQAQTQYEYILEKHPNSATMLSNLAFIYQQTGNDKAQSTAQKAYELAPDNAAINDTLGWILVKQGDAQQGLPYLREAHSRASNNPEIRYHIAAALAALGRNEEALSELKQALASPLPFYGIEDARKLHKRLKTP